MENKDINKNTDGSIKISNLVLSYHKTKVGEWLFKFNDYFNSCCLISCLIKFVNITKDLIQFSFLKPSFHNELIRSLLQVILFLLILIIGGLYFESDFIKFLGSDLSSIFKTITAAYAAIFFFHINNYCKKWTYLADMFNKVLFEKCKVVKSNTENALLHDLVVMNMFHHESFKYFFNNEIYKRGEFERKNLSLTREALLFLTYINTDLKCTCPNCK